VLLADDHAIVLEGLKALVDGEPDMTVVGATTDGTRVPALVDESKPDVVVLDLELAGIRGTRVLELLRARPSSPKVLVLTAYTDGESLRAALDAGADGLALKTESPQQTLAAIRQVADGRLVFPQAASRWLRGRAGGTPEGALADALTPREQDVWELVAAGLSNQAIAQRLRLSENTVKYHLQHLFAKLGVKNRTEAALKFARVAPP
jgi:DNA-binding NarL/FixJ family response regulator